MPTQEILLDFTDLYLVAITVAGYLLFLFAQLVAMRVLKEASALRILLVCCMAGGLFVLGLAFLPVSRGWTLFSPGGFVPTLFGTISAEFVYAVLCFNYVIGFFNLGETARRIRIARELQNAGGSLSLEGLYEHYNAEMIMNARLGRLLRAGQVIKTDEGYRISSRVVLMQARILWLLKRILNVPDERV
jgi:hypothetical protein